jgi:glycosyltransferase involved in cell wall biosynthesis
VAEENTMSQAKKKVLFHLPIPIDFGSYNGTQGRVLGVLKYLRERKYFFEVDAVGGNKFGIPEWGSAQKQEILNFVNNVFVYEGERNLFDFLYTRSQSFYNQKLLRQQLPVDSYYFAPPGYLKYIRNLISHKNYDFIWINNLDYAHLAAEETSEATRIIDMHDITSRFRLVRKNIPGFDKLKFDYESNFKREVKLINKFDTVIIDAQDERKILSSHLPATKLQLVPTLIEGLSYESNIVPYQTREFKYDLLFVGANNQPNKDGLNFFLDSIFPEIVRRKPDIQFVIAGKIVGEIQMDASFKENVDCLGYVPDLADIYLKSRVAICPLVTGAGTKFKLVEAMAYAMPIVATKISASALSLIDGVNAFVTNDPRVYAEQILCLLNEPELAQKISQEVAITFKNEHSSSAVYSKLDEILGISPSQLELLSLQNTV